MKHSIAVARGDGIGPEIMEAVLHILNAVGAPLEIHEVEIGEKVYKRGIITGMAPETWDVLRKTEAFLKAPITTPQGGGFKSLNVTVRTTLGLYANVRPCASYSPFIKTKHPIMNVVIVRENEEDLYTGIEYRQTPEVCTSIKLISEPGCEKIVRYAFEYARANGRKKVSCFTKDNIMKFSDGLFTRVFLDIAKEYPDIEHEHWIVDIGAAKLADTPENFDVVVLPNLYGDILSDVAAQISGSVGLAGSANIGDHGAMFEAIHGSAPRRAGQNMANPSGLLFGSLLMLQHLGLGDLAENIHNAWLKTIEEGVHTYDIFVEGTSKEKVGTKEFAEAVAKNLGQKPKQLKCASYSKDVKEFKKYIPKTIESKRELVGVDVYFYEKTSLSKFVDKMKNEGHGNLKLQMITNRGAKVYPEGQPETFCIDQWRCRFTTGSTCTQKEISELYSHLSRYDIIKTENLYSFDGTLSYSHADVN